MAIFDYIVQISYTLLGIIIFVLGFYLVYKNLKKVNLIEGEKFNLTDGFAMIGFGALFAISMVFMLDITLELINTSQPLGINIPSIAGLLLTIMIIVLFIYPLWEIFFLGKPTSDSVHDFHKFLESKILDKFRGRIAYLVSFFIFLVIYILPIFLLKLLLPDRNIIQIGLMWFLLFPLLFLQYFAANGTASGVIKKTYQSRIPKSVLENSKGGQKFSRKLLNLIFLLLAWIPFLLNAYNVGNPTYNVLIKGETLISQSSWLLGIVSLITTVPFGIKGFFSKFWNRKSKTKTIDFLFAGYIFIGIGVNMLLSFIKINPTVVGQILEGNWILQQLNDLFADDQLLLPIIIIQSLITFTYGIVVILRPNTDFNADIKVQATTNAFGKIDIYELIKERQDQIQKLRKGETASQKKEKKKKYNFLTLYKSLLLKPQYSKYGVDLNQQVRFKSAQYLLLIALEDKIDAQDIVNFIFKTNIDPFKDEQKTSKHDIYISKEAIDLLGEIGETYPDLVVERLIDALSYSNIYLQRFILDALGDIGEIKSNIQNIVDHVHPLFLHPRYEVRQAAFSSITEMLLEGNSEDKDTVNYILTHIYQVLEDFDNSDIIDTCFEAIVDMSSRIADDIDIEKIIPFLGYNRSKDEDTNNFIQQNTIIVLSYVVYYNLPRFESLITQILDLLEDERFYIRYVAADTIGNYILKGNTRVQEILQKLVAKSLRDPSDDVAYMCTESITEFLITHPGYKLEISGESRSFLDIYLDGLKSESRLIVENASEALKLISPLYDEDISPIINEILISASNEELIRDALDIIAESGIEEHQGVSLDTVYKLTKHEDPLIRSAAIRTLGAIAADIKEIDETYVIACLMDPDPQVRQESIFALGKIGLIKPVLISQILIEKFYDIDREKEESINEVELFAETLGIIGSKYPSNEIIISLQSALMGDTHPFSKDVIAKALGKIGEGMITSGNASRSIENEAFYNQISWLRGTDKKEYTIGNLIIIFIEALQLKGISDPVMNEISDSIQDLLPVFLFAEHDTDSNNVVLETIKELLAQAYYANYNSEILETIDRIDSLISFKQYFEVSDPALKDELIFYAKNYTPDARQFFDQGNLFYELSKQDPKYVEYALKSYEISIELAPYEYFTPSALLQLGIILKSMGLRNQSIEKFKQALEIYTSLDQVENMQKCEEYLEELHLERKD